MLILRVMWLNLGGRNSPVEPHINQARIDTHVHTIPPTYASAVNKAGGEPSGWQLPSWSPSSAIRSANHNGVAISILSVTSPGPAVLGSGEDGRRLARECNDWCEDMVNEGKENRERFRYFASLPSWEDVDGTVKEIEYAFEKTSALGVVVMTSYGDRSASALSRKLEQLSQERHAQLDFSATLSSSPFGRSSPLTTPLYSSTYNHEYYTPHNSFLPPPTSNRLPPRNNPHSSRPRGTLPFLFDRAVACADIPIEDFRKFYLDTALGTSPAQIEGLLKFTTPDKLLFGTDFPYALDEGMTNHTSQLNDFLDTPRGKQWALVNRENVVKMFGERLNL
ncbi:hypothetical protein JAAARDRAFT_189418 [Jaapia argillacea MUCL 33604]|uniref:Amidohydrolase-related domain-containing protein n=1 Tax=Jaapia argillacea MUCL 33604 TaxID=933084 RepID=A0A067Q4Z5_9AGAM|nr:hypothetical protein JAAARDRAFT_189418 [Jaapia argillacea MUCL 33604]